jgi:hypothetical protein
MDENIVWTTEKTMSGGSKNPEIEAERRRKIGEANRIRWANPEYKIRTSRAISKSMSAKAASISQTKKTMWADEEFNKRMSEVHVAVWKRPGERERRRATHKARWENPLLHKQYSDKANELWSDPEFRQRAVTASGRAARKNCPNGLEKRYITLLDRVMPGEWIFTGGGEHSRAIGRRRPDFTHTRKNKVIELFGTYWHKDDDPQDRIDHYQKYGYQCLVIWENESLLSAMHKIRDFTNL